MRFGLIGTGYWARATHAAAIGATDGCDLVGVWGRDPAKAAALAADVGARPYDDPRALFADVDAVAFSVPPDVQARLAVQAARAGCHLLLEKPIATTVDDAVALASAVDEAGVASVVFFTSRFLPEVRAWLDEVERSRPWHGATALWLGAAFQPGSPFDTPWRHDKGGLWDVGPHALSMLWPTLGPVHAVAAVAGDHGVTQLALRHDGGATSTATLTLEAPPTAAQVGLTLWGPAGTTAMPAPTTSPAEALKVANEELRATAGRGGRSHPCDVRLGRDIVEVLARAEAQLT